MYTIKTVDKQSGIFLNDISALVEKIIKEESKTNSEDLNKILLEYTRLVSHYVTTYVNAVLMMRMYYSMFKI